MRNIIKPLLFVFVILTGLFFIETAQAATFTVTNTNDSGAGSLRQAITDANANPGLDTIDFSPALGGQTITPLTPLPELGSIILDGTTTNDDGPGPDITIVGDPGFYGTLIFSSGSSNVIKGIAISGGTGCFVVGGTSADMMIGGTGARDGNTMDNCTRGISIENITNVTVYNNAIGKTVGNTSSGFNILGSSDITIGGAAANQRNIIVNNGEGLRIGNSTDITIQGNYIGTSTGADDLGNTNWGILTEGNTANIVIGGSAAGEGNVISGNGSTGIANDGTSENTIIQGNYVGVTADGTAALANGGDGIRSSGDATIGGTEVGASNLVSGNGSAGIRLQNNGYCTVQGNIVGLNAEGTAAIPNGTEGVIISSESNLIGGTTADARNIISGNTLEGLTLDGEGATENIIEGNYIGTNLAGTAAIPNARHGVYLIAGPTNNQIGVAGYGNVISGNGNIGIRIDSENTANNTVQANIIGLAADGITPVGNTSSGIVFFNSHNTTVGSADADTARNIISGNGQHGILLDNSSSNTIVNNDIGVAADGTTPKINGQDGINLTQISQLNTIGGTATNAGNAIFANAANDCFFMNNTTGHFNQFRANDCLSAGSSGIIDRLGTGNENIANPTVTAATATTSYIEGTATADSDVDIYIDGLYASSTTSTAAGTWSKNMSIASGGKVSVAATNANHSTSRTSAPQVTVADDNESPSPPTVTSPTNGASVNTATITLTGTKPAYTSVWINGIEQVANDGLTVWTVNNVALAVGSNNFVITTRDLSLNASSEFTCTIIRTEDVDDLDDGDDDAFNVSLTARSDFQAIESSIVLLTATVTNPDDRSLTYQWTQTSGPSATIVDGNNLRASITVPASEQFSRSMNFCISATDGINTTACTSEALLTIRIIPKEIDTESYPGQSEYIPYNLRGMLPEDSRQLSNAGLLILETEEYYASERRHTISFGNTSVLTESDEQIQILVWDAYIIISDPLFDSSRGLLAVFDSTNLASRVIDLTKRQTQIAIDAVLGDHQGDLFGQTLSLFVDENGDTLLAVSAPGSETGQVFIFDFDHLEVKKMIAGSNTDKLKTLQMLTPDLNGDGVDEIILGVTSASVLETAALSFVGFVDPPAVIDLSEESPTFAFETSVAMDLAACGDINGDGFDDCVFGSRDECVIAVLYGSADLADPAISDEVTCEGGLSSLTSGDVTGDGIDDIILGIADDADGAVHIMLGRTDLDTTGLSFDDTIVVAGHNEEGLGEDVFLTDYNGDGRLDIISHLANVENRSLVINLDNIVYEEPGSWRGLTTSSSGCALNTTATTTTTFWWLWLMMPVGLLVSLPQPRSHNLQHALTSHLVKNLVI